MRFKFYYQIFPIFDNKSKKVEEIGRPIIEVIANYKYGRMFGPLKTMADSGADHNLFPAEVADALGIKVHKGKVLITEGIGGRLVKTYRHSGIKMFLEGYSFETSVDFSDEIDLPLLGQQGFFDKFKSVNFSRSKEEVILET